MKLVNVWTRSVLWATCISAAACAAPVEEGDAIDPSIVIGEDDVDLGTETFRESAYTSTVPIQTRTAPYDGDNATGPDRGASARFGTLSVGGEQGAAGSERPTALIFEQFTVPPAESKVVVTTTVNVTRGFVRVVGALFGYAKGDVTLHFRVKDPTGNDVCQRNITLAKTEGAAGEHRGDASLGPLTVSCDFRKDADVAKTYRAEVSLSTFREAWGGAWVQSSGAVTVNSITLGRRIEPGVIVGHQGLCLEPSGFAVPGVPTRLAECVGTAHQKWLRHASGAIVHRSSGLCLDVLETPVHGTQPKLAACNANSPRNSARYTVSSLGVVTHSGGLCLDASWPAGGLSGDFHNTPVILWSCLSHRPGNQLWTFQ
ncbi:MAG TPA: RICIN domain-containing protein [Labilithrix sp.]|jgi:hypothetical protein|nr:RICIN domain-containing protein [Labilithrix sp.]